MSTDPVALSVIRTEQGSCWREISVVDIDRRWHPRLLRQTHHWGCLYRGNVQSEYWSHLPVTRTDSTVTHSPQSQATNVS